MAPPDTGFQHAHDDTYAVGGLSGPDADAERQQQQFIQAMMGGSGGGGGLGGGFGPDTAGMQDPMAAFMAALGGPGGPGGDFPGASPFPANANQTSPFSSPFAPPAAPKPKTRFERFLPLLHIISTLSMIAFFVLRLDNHIIPYITMPTPDKNGPIEWGRWAELGQHRGANWVFHAIVSIYFNSKFAKKLTRSFCSHYFGLLRRCKSPFTRSTSFSIHSNQALPLS